MGERVNMPKRHPMILALVALAVALPLQASAESPNITTAAWLVSQPRPHFGRGTGCRR
jgi:hypothetical protein